MITRRRLWQRVNPMCRRWQSTATKSLLAQMRGAYEGAKQVMAATVQQADAVSHKKEIS